MWLARDKYDSSIPSDKSGKGLVFIYAKKPIRCEAQGIWFGNSRRRRIEPEELEALGIDLSWEDEPKEITIEPA